MHIIQLLIIRFFISLRHADFTFYILVTQKSPTHVQKSPVKKNGKLRFIQRNTNYLCILNIPNNTKFSQC